MEAWFAHILRVGQQAFTTFMPQTWPTGVAMSLMICAAVVATLCSIAVMWCDRQGEAECPAGVAQAAGLQPPPQPDLLTPRELVAILYRVATLDLSALDSDIVAAYAAELRRQLHRWECQPARDEAPHR